VEKRGLAILLALLLTTAAYTQTCSPNASQQSAADVHVLQAKLFAIPEIKDDLPYDAPLSARSDVPSLLNALASAVERYMDCDARSSTAPPEIEQHLAVLLGANRPESATALRNGYPDHTYGDRLAVHVKPLDKPELLAIDLSFSIGCGDNHMLLVFRHTEQAWQKALDWHSNKYTQPSDAFGDFFVYALVPGPTNDPLMAIAYGTPWCSSRMSGFHVDLLRPADESLPQALLAHLDEGYSRDDHIPTALKQTSDGFQIRVWNDSFDFDNLLTRPRIYRFRTAEAKLERIQPIADNARDFVDVWLQSPWTDSQKWTQQPTLSLHFARDRFDYSLNKTMPMIQYGPVRACSSGIHNFQVEIDLTEFIGSKPTLRDLPPLFAKVRQNPNSFTMMSITGDPDPTCTGPDLTKKVDSPTPR
jgi:hypothetical protein